MHNVRLVIALITALGSASLAAAGDHPGCSLDEAYQAALGNSEVIKIAQEDLMQTSSRVDQAWSYIYPRVDGKAVYTRYNETLPPGGGPMLFQPLGQLQAAIVVTQPLYTGGRTLAALRTAQTMRTAGGVTVSLVRQEILLQVADAFYGVLKATKAVTISKRSLGRLEQQRSITAREAETRSTKANKSALMRADALVSMARISAVRAGDNLAIARERFRMLTKLPNDLDLVEPQRLSPSDESLESMTAAALRDRDDLASARLNSRIAEENITIVKGGHLPQVAAVAGASYTDSSPATAMDATVYYGGVQVEIPIFEGGLMKAEMAEARSKVRQAELALSLAEESVKTEVHDAFINLKSVSSVVDTAKEQLSYAQGNYEAVSSLFADGLLSSLSMIDAEQALTLAESELANAEYDQQLAILHLRKSIGMLGREDN